VSGAVDSEDDVLSPVEELTDRVEVAGVRSRLNHHVQRDGAHVGEPDPGVSPPVLGLLRRLVEAALGEDLVRTFDSRSVRRQHLVGRLVGTDHPVTVLILGQKSSGSPATTTPNQ